MRLKTLFGQLGDRRWRRFYFQRRFMRPKLRMWVAGRIARRRGEPPSPAPGAEAIARELRDIGQVNFGRLLDDQQCAEIRAWLLEREVDDLYRPDSIPFLPRGEGRDPLCHVAYHRARDIVEAPYLLELANDPRILDALHHFFGCRPVISYLASWWSYPTAAGPQQAENFHRDVDDWSFIKLFVYLSDVGGENGPHVYVRSSAGDPRLNRLGRFQDQEIADTFGRQALAVQTGRAGDAFIENTFGFHKGTHVGSGTRLVFQAVYSLYPIAYGPAAPVARFDDRLTGDEAARRTNRVYLS